ncbi:MAG TPA: GxxExxY protein [Rhizomicrobium sp.]|nr:GxxExxY protein [Rhizomicrobium sp.]
MVLSHDSALSDRIIAIAIDVHRQLGPGLLESAYEECLCHDLKEAGIAYDRQRPLPIIYKTVKLDCGYRMDIVVEGELIIEIKAVERLMPIHEAQMLTYLRLSRCKVGLLMNFNSVSLKDGLRRFVL